ncbi:uncharacterized protein YALI1_A06735g [Yarrowia lipolytica]|uniref:Uncharacterized protein n=1 Tax=Yarrowia lipolytica TaxID=4952 RepID=A0A1D8N3X2_YARLL|nr:hypothetical protein YALI1_A06735g [Yarrowia lipolytica]
MIHRHCYKSQPFDPNTCHDTLGVKPTLWLSSRPSQLGQTDITSSQLTHYKYAPFDCLLQSPPPTGMCLRSVRRFGWHSNSSLNWEAVRLIALH